MSEQYAVDVASLMSSLFGSDLVGVYLHGSAALGGFDARRSDVDVLAVCEKPLTVAKRSAAAEALSEQRLPCPARGLELSIVTLEQAQHPTPEPAFELHMTTAPEDTKVVDGHESAGDPDLVLHFLVCRTAGRLLGTGRPVGDVFAPIADDLVLMRLREELRWAAERAPGEYAVLNACRAWRFASDGEVVSKIDGGRGALDRAHGADRALITCALDRQRSLTVAGLHRGTVERFDQRVHSYLQHDTPGMTAGR